MEDEAIIALYFQRDEQAIRETDKKYGGYCHTLAKRIISNDQDAEEVVSDTWMQTWKAIPPKKPEVFKLFLAKITRNLAFNRWRAGNARKRGGGEVELVLEELEGCIPAPGSVEDRMNARELVHTIRGFLDTLPAREQNIFLRRYFFVEETSDIARRYGMKRDTVNRTLSRTREKLKDYLTEEGYGV